MVVFNRITATLANPGIAYTATLDGLDSGTNEGSTFDPATGIFYILDQNTSPDRLVEVSLLPGGFITVTEIGTGGLTTPTTPAAQPGIGIGLTGNEGAGTNRVTGITIDPANGQMYGVTGDRYLFKINKATGKVVPLGMNGGTVDWVQINLTAGGVFGHNRRE